MWSRLAVPSLAAVAILVLGWFVPVAKWSETCIVCRLMILHTDYGPFPVSRSCDTVCSRWYASHVEPSHTHIWEQSRSASLSNLYGTYQGFRCGRDKPMDDLPPDTQMGVYQHFKNPVDAKPLFLNLGHLTVWAMREWQAAEFPGTWEDWWTHYQARQVEVPGEDQRGSKTGS